MLPIFETAASRSLVAWTYAAFVSSAEGPKWANRASSSTCPPCQQDASSIR